MVFEEILREGNGSFEVKRESAVAIQSQFGKMIKSPDISIVIPAYNEENRLPVYLDSVFSYFKRQDYSYEVIIVDDGSIDSTAAVVEKFAETNSAVRLIRLPHNRGKGYAVKTGMLQARGLLRLFSDADGATPIAELERLVKAIERGAEVAIGSRALHDDSCMVRAWLHRKIIGSVFNFIVRILTVKGISDTQCGFKLFTSNSAATVFPLQHIEGFCFDVEILFISVRKGFRIEEVPVNWNDNQESKVRLIIDSWRMFIDVLKIRRNYLLGLYQEH